jgi:hypothetical protein
MQEDGDFEKVFFFLPSYISDICDVLIKSDWFVHNFDSSSSEDVFNPANYLKNIELGGSSYEAVVDLNVYQFILGILKKGCPKDKYRLAASFIAFCQIAKIDIDPTYCVYEKYKFDSKNLDEAVDSLKLFYGLNGADNEELAKYALGFSDEVSVSYTEPFDRDDTLTKLTHYQALTGWKSLYAMMLKIVNIHFDSSITHKKKLQTFVDWMYFEFRQSLAVVVYAAVLWGKKPLKRLMKYNPKSDSRVRKSQVINMTWDLYLVTQFFDKWIKKAPSKEFLYVSDDAAFRDILRLAIDIQKSLDLTPVSHLITNEERVCLRKLVVKDAFLEAMRVYNTSLWGAKYRDRQIARLEHEAYS